MISALAIWHFHFQSKLPSIEFEGTKVSLVRVGERLEQEVSVGGHLVLVSSGHPLVKSVADPGLTPIRFTKARELAEKSGISLILESTTDPKQTLKIKALAQGQISCAYSSTYTDMLTPTRGEIVQYCLVPDRKLKETPTSTFSPQRLGGPTAVNGDHLLGTPIVMATAGGWSTTLVLNQEQIKPGSFPCAMTLDCSMSQRPAATLGVGCLAYVSKGDQTQSPKELRRAAGPKLQFSYDVFVRLGEANLIKLANSEFQQQRSAFEWFAAPQVMPFHEYVRLGYTRGPNQILADGIRAWTERDVPASGGDKKIGAVAKLDANGKRWVEFGVRNNPMLSAYGILYWASTLYAPNEGDSTGQKGENEKQGKRRTDWFKLGEQTIELLLTAPRKDNLIPQSYMLDGRGWKTQYYASHSASAYTYLWLLRAARAAPSFIDKERAWDFVEPLYTKILEGDATTLLPENAPYSLMLLLEGADFTSSDSITSSCQKLVHIIQDQDIERGAKDQWSLQGEKRTFDLALRLEALGLAHRRKDLNVDADVAHRLIVALSLMQQQRMSQSRQSALLWGSFRTSNFTLDGDLIATGTAAIALMAAGAEWNDETAFRRGVAALHSTLALANNTVTIANGVFVTDMIPDNLIYTTWGGSGTDGNVQRDGFYGGEGAVLANLAFAQSRFGDSFQLDAANRPVIGINGLADGAPMLSTVATVPTAWLTTRKAISASEGQSPKTLDVGTPYIIREMHLALEAGKMVLVATPNFTIKNLPERPQMPSLRWVTSRKSLSLGPTGFSAPVTASEIEIMPWVEGFIGNVELQPDRYPLLPSRLYVNPTWTFASNDLTDWRWNVNSPGIWNPTSTKAGEITTGWSYQKMPDAKCTGMILSPEFLINCERIEFVTAGAFDAACVIELTRADGSAIFSETGQGSGESVARVWTVGPYRGENVRIRILDQSKTGYLALRRLASR